MKLNDRQLTGMLIDILGAPAELATPEEVLDWAQSYCGSIKTPFSLRTVRIVYDRIAVKSGATMPKNGAPLVQYLSETQDQVVLASDQYSAGKDALFFASFCDRDTAVEWVRCFNERNRTEVHIGARQNRMVIAASVLAFIQ